MSVRATLYSDNRGAQRMQLDRASTLRDGEDTPFDVQIEDISLTGFRMQLPFEILPDQATTIGVPGVGIRAVRIVRVEGTIAGCAFVQPLNRAELDTILRFDSSVVQENFKYQAAPANIAEKDGSELSADTASLSPPQKLAIVAGAALTIWLLILAAMFLI
ncbi:MAG: PilZ domain-containing protein [Pseudomonadota bacterium]|nr:MULTISPECIES: PilZ domain-containing protein [Sphingobium]